MLKFYFVHLIVDLGKSRARAAAFHWFYWFLHYLKVCPWPLLITSCFISPAEVAHQFQYAVRVIGSNYAPTIERDEFLVSEKIKKERKLAYRWTLSPDDTVLLRVIELLELFSPCVRCLLRWSHSTKETFTRGRMAPLVGKHRSKLKPK